MIGSAKEWASLLGFDRESDEKTMAARGRVVARTLAYLEAHFSDPDGRRPSEELVMEFGQFLVLAESMEQKGRSAKFKELYETIVDLHLRWDEVDRDEVFRSIAKRVALFKGVLAFSDAWQGSETPIPGRRPSPEAAPYEPEPSYPEPMYDDADVKTRIVRPSQMR